MHNFLSGRLRKSPRYSEVFFRLSECGKFGVVLGNGLELTYVASKSNGVAYARMSYDEGFIDEERKNYLCRLINAAPRMAFSNDHVEARIREEVRILNLELEHAVSLINGVRKHAEKFDEEVIGKIRASYGYK